MQPPPQPPSSTPPPLPTSPARARRQSTLLRKLGLTLVALVAGFVGFRLVQIVWSLSTSPTPQAPGEEALHQATLLIATNQHHGTAYGNSPAAQEVAEQLAGKMKEIRRTLFTGGDPDALDMHLFTEGEFLVYCRLNEEDCVFLIHVPEMHRDQDSAEEPLVKLAYLAGCAALDEHGAAGVHKLAVATRGNLLYDKVVEGDYHPHAEDPLASLHKLSDGALFVPRLNAYFAAPPSASPNPRPLVEP